MTAVYILLNLFWQWLAWIEIRSDERIKQESSPPPHGRPLGFVNGGGYDIRPLSPFPAPLGEPSTAINRIQGLKHFLPREGWS
jgi:hypothetical protein